MVMGEHKKGGYMKVLLKCNAGVVEDQVSNAAVMAGGAMKKNLLRVGTTLMTMLLASVSAWAGNHQICFQLPSPARTQTLQARFLCRTDGATGSPCTVTSVNPDPFTSGFASHQGNVFSGGGQGGADFNLSTTGTYIGTITFNDGTVRSCSVQVFQSPFI